MQQILTSEKKLILGQCVRIFACSQKHSSFTTWFRQDLIFALDTQAGSDFLIGHPANFFSHEINRPGLWKTILYIKGTWLTFFYRHITTAGIMLHFLKELYSEGKTKTRDHHSTKELTERKNYSIKGRKISKASYS